MKKLLIGLTLLVSMPSFATCNLGIPKGTSDAEYAALADKGYEGISMDEVENGDLYLKLSHGSKRSFPLGLFCTTQYVDISIVQKGKFNREIDKVRFSGCSNLSSAISNYSKKKLSALNNLPNCL